MIDLAQDTKTCYSGLSVLHKQVSHGEDAFRLLKETDALEEFLDDVENAKKYVRIDIPNQMGAANAHEISAALKSAKKRGIRIFLRVESKQGLPSNLLPFAVENSNVCNPVVLIDDEIVWFGMPNSEADFVVKNRNVPTKYRPIFRFVGTRTAKLLLSFLGMNGDEECRPIAFLVDEKGRKLPREFAVYTQENQICEACGHTMDLARSKKGALYLRCAKCRKAGFVTIDFVEEHLNSEIWGERLCGECGCSLEVRTSRCSGIYLRCCGEEHHTYTLDEI